MFTSALALYWNNDLKVRQFIEIMRKNEPLWKVDHPGYKNKIVRESLLMDISYNLSIPVEDIKKKWNNLRTQFSRELVKVKNGEEKLRWRFFDDMAFIKDCIPAHALGTSTHAIIEENSMDDNVDKNLPDDSIDENLTDENISENSKDVNKKIKQSERRNSNLCDSVLYNASEVLKDLAARLANMPKSNSQPADSFQLFGNYIADELRNMPNQTMANQVQMQIMEVIVRSRGGNTPGCPSRNARQSTTYVLPNQQQTFLQQQYKPTQH